MPEPPLLTADNLLAAIVALSASGTPPTMTEVADANGWPRYTLPDLVRTMARRNVIWKDLAGHLYVGLRKERDSVPHPPSWTPSSPVPQPQDEPRTKRTYGQWPPDEEFASLVEVAKMEHGSGWAQALTRTLHKSWASIRQHRAKVNKRLQKPSASPAPPADSDPADVPGTASPALTLPPQEVGERVDIPQEAEAVTEVPGGSEGHVPTPGEVEEMLAEQRTPPVSDTDLHEPVGDTLDRWFTEQRALETAGRLFPHQQDPHRASKQAERLEKELRVWGTAYGFGKFSESSNPARTSVPVRRVLAVAIDEIPDDAALVRFVKRIVTEGTVS